MTADEIGALARMLQKHTALGDLCTDMQVRGAIQLALQRGYRIAAPPEQPFPFSSEVQHGGAGGAGE